MKMSDISFLIVGATKSATTWLQQSLQLDPAVFMPDPELHYFSREFHRGDEWYLAHFANGDKHRLVGEKSNSYLDCPEAPSRIHAALPQVKLVAQLRNPIERAYSDYCMLYRRGQVSQDIERYLDPRVARNTRFLVGGLYHQHLQAYLRFYPPSHLLSPLYEEISSEPTAQLARVRSFLGLDAATPATALQEKIKDKTLPVISPALRRPLGPFKPLLAPIRRTQYFKALHRLFARETEYPVLTRELRNRLVDYYALEIDALATLIGRDLSSWLETTPSAAPQRKTASFS